MNNNKFNLQYCYEKALEIIKKPKPADIGEAAFDICYLTFDFVAGIIFLALSKGKILFVLYGILALTLMAGDAFHLVPRVVRALKGPSEKVEKYMGLGLGVSSVTMTIFYIILLYIWKATFPELAAPLWVELLIWVSALIRILICLLPQNHWITGEGSMTLSVIRNTIFLFTGIGVIILYSISGNAGGFGLYKMVIAIIISFGCYIPVVWGAKKVPMLGMLMIPKTCAYVWMICMGLTLLGM